jgi:hypothetical protein
VVSSGASFVCSGEGSSDEPGVAQGVQMINTDCVEIFEIEDQALDQVSDQVEWEVWHHVEYKVWYNVSNQVKNPVWFKVFV